MQTGGIMKKIIRMIGCGIFAVFGQKYLFNLFNFNYDVFNDDFNITKLLIDFGVFVALFIFASIVIDRFKKKPNNE